MTLILDAGGVSALARQRARLIELCRRGLWPAQVPSVVLAESLTGITAGTSTPTGYCALARSGT